MIKHGFWKSLGMHTDSVVIRIHAQSILPHMNMFFVPLIQKKVSLTKNSIVNIEKKNDSSSESW